MAVISTPRAEADEALLRRFVARREADAFAELARRHASLVFGTCLRVTGDRHDAEELSQECFLRLAARAATVRTSVAGWLHATATRLALNAVRARGRRRDHETMASLGPLDVPADLSPWHEIEPILDEAVEGLPDEFREAIVLHFLRSMSQSEVAMRLGVHQSTVSRRIAEGLRHLHDRLVASGVTLATIPLADLLAAEAAPAGVPDLSGTIGRVALSGAASGLLGAAGSGWVKAKALLYAAVAWTSPAVVELAAGLAPGALAAAVWLALLARLRPRWMDDLFGQANGQSVYDGPFYPLRRWTWEVMPEAWGRRMFVSFGIGLMFLVQSWALSQPRVGGGGMPVSGAFLVYGLLAISTSLRIAFKAATGPRATATNRQVDPADAPNLVQAIGVALAATLASPCLGLVVFRSGERPAVLAAILIPIVVGSIGSWIDAVAKARRFIRDRAGWTYLPIRSDAGGRSRLIFVATMLVFSAFMATGPLAAELILRGNSQYAASPQGGRHLEAAEGMQPAIGLLILAAMIRPMALVRATLPGGTWPIVLAIAILLSLIQATSCIVYLIRVATG